MQDLDGCGCDILPGP
ncbi:unnamed protein product, partial [Adineta steineri]